jgi:asparagine synthase (glutamine-hydrolysing)
MEAYYNETSDYARYTSLFSPFSKDEQTNLLRKEFQNNDYEHRLKHIWDDSKHKSRLSKILLLDRMGFLSHNFIVADKSSMLSSIELRVPLATEYRFLKNLGLKSSELIGVRFRKKQLRRVLLNNLPKRFVDRPKRGFHPPIDTKINALGAERLKNEIGKGVFSDYFDLEKMYEIVDNHFLSRENNTFKIYRLLFISKWLSKNVA